MDGTLALVGVKTHRPFDCHVAVSDVAPGSGSGVLVLRNEGGDGLWVVVVGACGMDLGVEADDDISHHRLGLFVAWEVRASVVNDGCWGWVSSFPWL